jgi:hypothetical protein
MRPLFIAPSILLADFAKLGDEIRTVDADAVISHPLIQKKPSDHTSRSTLYDIYYCVRNFPGGPAVLANRSPSAFAELLIRPSQRLAKGAEMLN